MKKLAVTATFIAVLVLSVFAADKDKKNAAKKEKAKKEQCCAPGEQCDAPNPWCCEDPGCCLEVKGKKQELKQAAKPQCLPPMGTLENPGTQKLEAKKTNNEGC